jgi:hypothetical protein
MNTKQTPWDFSTILRLMGLLWLAGIYLQMTRWTTHLGLVTLLLLLGFGIGLLLGKSGFRLWENILYLLTAGWVLLFLIMPFAVDAAGSLFRKQLIYLDRLGISFGQLVAGKPVADPILFLSIVSLIACFLGIFVGFLFNRTGNPWLGVACTAFVIVAIDMFLPSNRHNGMVSALFVIVVVLLATRLFYIGKKEEWKRRRIEFHDESGFDLSRQVIVNSLLIVVVAWSLPSVIKAFIPGTLENDRLQSLFERFSGNASNLVSSLENPGEGGEVVFRVYFALGNQIPTGEEQVFAVEASSLPPGGYHFYWKSRTYDFYQDGQWSDSESIKESYRAFETLENTMGHPGLLRYNFTFKVMQQSGNYYFAGTPFSANSAGTMVFARAMDNQKDVTAVLPNKVLVPGEVYQTTSWINWASDEDLRNSDQNYPNWIIMRYLQIPDDFPQQVKDLAAEITQGLTNPYDKALAITNYLRNNITYTTAAPDIPEGKDPVDWLLFDSKKGFCTYYATAEVMMLRSIGIPARLAIGYSQGDVSPSGKLFRVRVKNSHAWPEVYFNSIGWIEFEPTTTMVPQIAHPAGFTLAEQSTTTNDQEFEQLNFENQGTPQLPSLESVIIERKSSASTTYIVVGVVLFLACGTITAIIVWYRNMTRREKLANFPCFVIYIYSKRKKKAPAWIVAWAWRIEQPKIERVFDTINKTSKALHLRIRSSQTPAEKVGALVMKLPEAEKEAAILLSEYQRSIYADRPANLHNAAVAARKIRSLGRRRALQNAFRRK